MPLLRAFATVGSFTLISRVTGFARDMLVAGFLGAGAAADAFLVAFQFPNLFRRLFAEGAFSAGFVPIFSRLYEADGAARAKEFADAAFSMLAAVVLVFCAAVMVAMPAVLHVVAPGFARTPGQMAHAVELARITFPYLLFISLVSLQSGVLNALHRFAAAAAVPIILNLTLIAFLVSAAGLGAEPARALAWGVPAAGALQFAWLIHHCRRAGLSPALRRPRLTPEVKDLLARMLPVAFGAGVYQINLVVNNLLATLVAVGAVSWLYYADRVNQLPLGVVGVAIGVALLPLLSRQIQGGHEAAALANQNRAIEVSLLLTLPAAVGIGVLAQPIAATLFERGAFGPADRDAVAAALRAFAFGLPAYVLIKALTPGFFARHDTLTPVKISVVALIANVGIALALIGPLGHVGIALATTVSAWINVSALAVVLVRRGHFRPDARLVARAPRLALASAAMAAGLWALSASLASALGSVFGAPGVAAGPEYIRALALAGLVAAGAVIYFAAVMLLRAADRSDLAALRRQPPRSA
ncbi:MAG: murein biosynthesis integral membrane protein MurJ [Rhodospirillaceae bacterium]|nr:murein biosynthesis integral membrane protein MurJ [Rhodospirillaceae bacterium]